MKNKFNPKEQNFIDQMVNYCGKKTATQCAIDSGFGVAGARSRASELMAKDSVRNEIERRLEETREKWNITKEKHFQELGELRDIAKETKNINAAVTAERLRGMVAGLYIDRQILAATKMVRLPDGQMKLEQDMTADDYEQMLMAIDKKYQVLIPNKNPRKSKK
jgi:phage terminase small subunit|tara:strand:+ start:106 stop:597 length:492 start_codon:yes stop_codon:yes gene_type:complete